MTTYFDFLEAYGNKLDKKLKNHPPITELIYKARCAGITEPSDTLHWCRLIGEAIVNSYDGGSNNQKMSLRLFALRQEGSITPQQGQGLASIWTIGSEYGSHAGAKVDQKGLMRKTLEVIKLLDNCLRQYIRDKIEGSYVVEEPVDGDPFINLSRIEASVSVQAVVSDSTIAAKHSTEVKELDDALGVVDSEEDSIREGSVTALATISALEERQRELDARKSEDVALIAGFAGILASGGALSDEDTQKLAAAGTRIAESDDLEKRIETLKDEVSADTLARQRLQEDYDDIKARADEILAEHDWIARMLNGKGKATEKQRAVIDRNDKILRIRGGAGTGKSLVLLTKCLSELAGEAFSSGQERLDFSEDIADKTALLVTFNKSLKNYLSDILSRLLDNPDITDTIKRAIKNITVVNYDSFISNKLKAFSDTYMLSSVIYQKGSRGDSGTLDYVKKVLGENITKDAQYFYDEEFAWIASQGDMTLERYLMANRRDNRDLSGLDLNKGSDGRKTVFESYEKFKAALHDDRRYTVSDITLDLLNHLDRLPKYDVVAIDEAQDFDLIRIKLIYSLRKDDNAKFYIVYDEAQKISKTTFNGEALDDVLPRFTGHGVVFEVNHRNHQDIAAFAARMKNANAALPTTAEAVVLAQDDPECVAARVAELPHAEESIAILLNLNAEISEWAGMLDGLGVPYRKLNDGDDVTRPGIYLSSLWTVKGLEFDRVIIAQMNESGSYYYHRTEHDNLYFVAFTRARKALEIYYQGIPHAILEERYGSMLCERDKSMGDLSPTASEASDYDESIPF